MKIETFVTGIIGTNTYVAYNETTKEAVLVDPAACTKKLMHFIEEEGLSMKAVLLTHGHFDHIMGIDGFCKVYDVPVYVGEKEAGLITDATGTSPISIRRAIPFLRRSMYRTEDSSACGIRFPGVFHTWTYTGGSLLLCCVGRDFVQWRHTVPPFGWTDGF